MASVRQAVTAGADEQTQSVFYYTDRVSRWSSPMFTRFPAREAEYREMFTDMTHQVSLGRTDPGEAPAILRRQVVALLARPGDE